MSDPLADDYLAWCVQEGEPPNTVRARRRVLTSIATPGTATREDVEAWWASRSDRAPATRSNDLAILRSFYKWCDVWERREDDPTRRIRSPKLPKGLPRPVSRADLRTILSAVDGDLRRAVCLGAYGGLRVSEAAALSWHDVDRETNRIRVLGKGAKTRLVGLSPLLLDELLPDTGGNVVSGGGDGYSAATLQRKVNRAIRAAGVEATFHQLRHRFVTVGLARTGDLLAVSRAAGHASPATTAIYAATSDESLDLIASAVAS